MTKTLGMRLEPQVAEQIQQLSAANGLTYNALLELLLSWFPHARDEQQDTHLEAVPVQVSAAAAIRISDWQTFRIGQRYWWLRSKKCFVYIDRKHASGDWDRHARGFRGTSPIELKTTLPPGPYILGAGLVRVHFVVDKT